MRFDVTYAGLMYSSQMFSALLLHGGERYAEMRYPELRYSELGRPFNRQVARVVRSGERFLSHESYVSR
jgi:hypothetical protein